jgi:AraC-like DNA-binding protein
VLADVLQVTRLGATVLGQPTLAAPWDMEIGPTIRAAMHIVQRGTCWLTLEGQAPPTLLGTRDIVLLTRPRRHWLSDRPRGRRRAPPPPNPGHDRGSGPDPTVLFCAGYAFEHDEPHALLDVLPPLIHLRADGEGAAPPIEAVSSLLTAESTGRAAGTDLVVPRLIETLLVYVVRAWADQQPAGEAGWLGALDDPVVGDALRLLHAEPDAGWSVAGLAARVGISRAALARRFTTLVGEPPMAYLAGWRMNLAAERLRTTTLSVEAVARTVGYHSTASFLKSFRRAHGTTPGRYRQRARLDGGRTP